MSDSYTYSLSETFTIVHARHIASKVATDLLRFTRFYNSPSIEWINYYEEELTALVKEDYLDNIIYGFKRNGKWTEASIRYHALPGGTLIGDDDPGKIRPGHDVSGAHFTSYLNRNSRWLALSSEERQKFENSLPFQRGGATEPELEKGMWSQGLTYSAGGRGIMRSTILC